MSGKGNVILGEKNDRNVSAPKCSDGVFRSGGGGEWQVDRAVCVAGAVSVLKSVRESKGSHLMHWCGVCVGGDWWWIGRSIW